MKITKKDLKDIISKQISKKKSVLKESFDVQKPFNLSAEENATKKFKFISKPVIVNSYAGIINDDYVDVDIHMSNGDIIHSTYEDNPNSFTVRNAMSASTFKKNMSGYWGSTGTVMGDILLAYKEYLVFTS